MGYYTLGVAHVVFLVINRFISLLFRTFSGSMVYIQKSAQALRIPPTCQHCAWSWLGCSWIRLPTRLPALSCFCFGCHLGNWSVSFFRIVFVLFHDWVAKLKPFILYFESGKTALKSYFRGLTGVAQWVGCRPSHQKLAGPIPGQDARLGCGPGPWLGAHGRLLVNVSPTH